MKIKIRIARLKIRVGWRNNFRVSEVQIFGTKTKKKYFYKFLKE